MTYEWHDLLGNIGVLLILLSYLLVQLDKMDTQGIRYSFINGLGAGFLCISLYINFNLSGLLMELSWLLISIYGLYRCSRRSPRDLLSP